VDAVVMVYEILERTYQDVCEWLKFAEAKNGALLTLNGLAVFEVLKELGDDKSAVYAWGLHYYFVASVVLLALSLIVIIWSFIPRIWSHKNKRPSLQLEGNPLFYGDIYKLDPKYYVNKLIELYGKPNTELLPYLEHQSKQIIQLSQIAIKKYKLFYVALVMSIIAMAVPLIGSIINLL
jgi:hypothetical protein